MEKMTMFKVEKQENYLTIEKIEVSKDNFDNVLKMQTAMFTIASLLTLLEMLVKDNDKLNHLIGYTTAYYRDTTNYSKQVLCLD